MKYKIELERSAQRFLRKQDKPTQGRILQALAKLPYEGDISCSKGKKRISFAHRNNEGNLPIRTKTANRGCVGH